MKLPENENALDKQRKNIPALKEIIDERKEKAVETLCASYSKNRLPLEEYERLVEYINKIESERELIVVEKIVAEYNRSDSPENKTAQPDPEKVSYDNEDASYFPEHGYNSSRENLTVLSSRVFQGPVKSGSQFVSILGNERIIIRKEDLRAGRTILDIVSVLGDSVVLVERGISVINRAIPILGNSDTRIKDYKNTVNNDKELIISGAAILGNITVKLLKD